MVMYLNFIQLKRKKLINKIIGCLRFIYDYFLKDKIKEYKAIKKSKSAYDQIKLILPSISEKPWLKEVDSCVLRTSLFNLEDAYKRFYNGSGYSKFKIKIFIVVIKQILSLG